MHSNIRPVAQPLVFGLFAVLALLAGSAGSGAAQRGCGSFDRQADAQTYFIEAGGNARHGVGGGLDTDHDGVACEGLGGPYAGYATLGYNTKRGYFYGIASLPTRPNGKGYACLSGNSHFLHAPRRVRVFKVTADGAKRVSEPRGTAVRARHDIGHLAWRADRTSIVPGRYYAEFEGRQRTSPYRGSECPAFRSSVVRLP